MIESAFYFSIMSVLVKLAGKTVPFQEIVLARTIVAFTLSYIMIRRMKVSPWGNRKSLLIMRGVFGFGGLSCFYYAVTHLPLADVTVIQYTNPVFVALLAALVLGERIAGVAFLAAFVSLVGVGIIAQPSFIFGGESTLDSFDVMIAVIGAVFSAFAYTTVRKLGETEIPVVVVFWFPMVSLPFITPWALSTGYIPDLTEIAILIGVGISTQIAQIRMTQGLQLEAAGRATSMTYLQIVFATVWGVLLFGEVPSIWTAIGGFLIVICIFLVARARTPAPSAQPSS